MSLLPPATFKRDAVNTIFLKYSNKGRFYSSQVGIQIILSDICYDDTKH